MPGPVGWIFRNHFHKNRHQTDTADPFCCCGWYFNGNIFCIKWRPALKKYEHIIWDWNGTLIDDAWLCVEILNEILNQYDKHPVTLEQYRMDFGFPVKSYYEHVGFDFNVESFETIAEEYHAIYDQRCFECKLQEGVVAVLEGFAGKGLTQSVLSACQQKRLEEMIAYYGIGGYFTKLFGLDDHYANGKVEKGLQLLSKLNISPENVLLIGDTLHDHEVAEAIGADCVLVPFGHHCLEKLRQMPAIIIDPLSDALTMPGIPRG
ncbi:MAG: HAD family hydrolase [Candidatus Brocadiia bacterium]|nr:MAG: HAD family hydrolase [Candidatus Brocadiia bacterium]